MAQLQSTIVNGTLVGNVLSPIVTVTGTTYTLLLSDSSKYLRTTNSSSVTITIPLDSSVEFPIGTSISIEQAGTGVVSVVGDGIVTVNTPSTGGNETDGQYTVISLIKVAVDIWTLIGGVS
jgi:hypothetical protein